MGEKSLGESCFSGATIRTSGRFPERIKSAWAFARCQRCANQVVSLLLVSELNQIDFTGKPDKCLALSRFPNGSLTGKGTEHWRLRQPTKHGGQSVISSLDARFQQALVGLTMWRACRS